MLSTNLERYNILNCIQCGRCTAGCPVSIRTLLNIRSIIYRDLRERTRWLQPQEIWNCTTCATCSQRCPKGVEIVDYIVGLREYQVERGKIVSTARDALESIFKFGNPWARVREKRTDWVGDEQVRILSEGESVDVLLFIGCTPAYDPKVQPTAKSLVKILKKADIDFAILGNVESCCGNEVKRMGEQGLFEMLVEDNTELFNKYSFNKLVTISPHCYNTFKNEYPDISAEVFHYTQFLAEIIKQGFTITNGSIDRKVIFHDPCFLGKQNNIYDEPREILSSIPGIELLEFDRSRERSVCCEGGGGRMWIEGDSEKERLAVQRVKDAKESGAEILATTCPFCFLTLSDAVKTAGVENDLEVLDIMEIVDRT